MLYCSTLQVLSTINTKAIPYFGLFLYVYVRVYIYIYIYIYIYTHIYICMCMYVNIYIHIYTFIFSVIKAEFATATVLITLGVILGKASPIQLFLISVVEVFCYSVNRGICEHILQAIDPGGAIYIHLFGAVFGLGVAKMLFNPRSVAHEEEISSYHSDLFAMLGKLFYPCIFFSLSFLLPLYSFCPLIRSLVLRVEDTENYVGLMWFCHEKSACCFE